MKYTDKDGYLRGSIEHTDLVHRQLAYKYIYLKNRDIYPKKFSEYQVHHINKNKSGQQKERICSNRR